MFFKNFSKLNFFYFIIYRPKASPRKMCLLNIEVLSKPLNFEILPKEEFLL